MSKFVYKIILFSLVFFALDKLFILAENRMPSLEYDQRLEKLINHEIKADIIILGSSRAARGILANELETVIEKPCYNLGYPGSNIKFHEFLLKKAIVQHDHKPKLIVLVLDDPGSFYDYKTINFRFDRLYPLTSYPEIREELIKRGKKTKFVVDWLASYRTRESFPQNLKLKQCTPNDTIRSHGSMPLNIVSPKFTAKKFNTQQQGEYKISKENKDKVDALLSMIKIAQKHQVKLLLVHPPNFYPPTQAFRKRILELVGPKVMIYNYDDSNPLYKDPQYFYDNGHLKLNGAKVFTKELSKKILTTIKQ